MIGSASMGGQPVPQGGQDINGMYQQLFGRQADQGGLDYWRGTGLQGDALRQEMMNVGRDAYLANPNAYAEQYGRLGGALGAELIPADAPNINTQAAQALSSAGQTSQALSQAGSGARDVTAGQLATTNLSPYTNPYEQTVVDQTMQDMERQRLMQQNTMDAQAGAAGAFGGSRHGVANAETNRAFADQFARTAGNLRHQGFTNAQNQAGQDINRTLQADLANQGMDATNVTQRLAASNQLANIGNLGFGMGQQIQNRMDMQGMQQQALNQALIDASKQQYGGYTGAPATGLGYMGSALGVTPVPQTQTTSKQPGLFDYLSLGASLVGGG